MNMSVIAGSHIMKQTGVLLFNIVVPACGRQVTHFNYLCAMQRRSRQTFIQLAIEPCIPLTGPEDLKPAFGIKSVIIFVF